MVPKRQAETSASSAVSAAPAPAPDLALAQEGARSVASPARELQAKIVQAYDPSPTFPEPEVEAWPGPVRLGVLVALVVGSWSLVAGGIWAGERALAWASGFAWSAWPPRL